jgi:hypothetical protein
VVSELSIGSKSGSSLSSSSAPPRRQSGLCKRRLCPPPPETPTASLSARVAYVLKRAMRQRWRPETPALPSCPDSGRKWQRRIGGTFADPLIRAPFDIECTRIVCMCAHEYDNERDGERVRDRLTDI